MNKLYKLFFAVSIVMAGASAATLFFGTTFAHAQSVITSGPTTPANVTAMVNRSNQVYVQWNASTETSTPVIGYYLYRNGTMIANTPGYPYYTDSVAAGAYSYTVAAYDKNGLVSPLSNPTQTVTVQNDTVAPTQPGALVASISTSSVGLSWAASTDNFGVIGYYIYKNGSRLITSAPITGTSYLDTNLSEGTSYTYSVVAYDAVGNISTPTPVVNVTTIFDVQAPTVPQGLIAKAISSNEIDLAWKPSMDNVQVVGYEIYRNGSMVATTASTSYNDMGLSAGTSYGYFVYAYDEAGNISVQGPNAGASTFPPDTTPPSIPTNFYATALSGTQVSLTWSSSTDNTGVTGYTISRDGTQIGIVTSTTYIDSNLSPKTTYQYFLKANDAANNISSQTSLAVTTLSTPTVVINAPTTTVAVVTTTPSFMTTASSSIGSSPDVGPITDTPQYIPVSTSKNNFTTSLYYGLRSSGVLALQTFLTEQGYLSASYDTGFYGNLTVAGVQKFQCAQNIICSGSAFTTGWGLVGPRTRAALNNY